MVKTTLHIDDIAYQIGVATMQNPKEVAYQLHRVIEGISNAPQPKVTKILSEKEIKWLEHNNRKTPKNYVKDSLTGNTRIVVKVKRGKVNEKEAHN